MCLNTNTEKSWEEMNPKEKKMALFLRQKEKVSLMNEIRTGHCNLMTKERWQKVKLFCSQKKTLDTFREKNAISQAQYDKSLGDLRNLMEMYGVE